MRAAILTTANQWFEPYARELATKLGDAPVYHNHRELIEPVDIVFILSYHRLVDKAFLERNGHNIVVHASALPRGKGWAPLFWQVLEGKKEIPFTLFEATEGVDSGDIYLQRNLILTGYELNSELRQKQAGMTIKLCLEFAAAPERYLPGRRQTGEETTYPKRSPDNSRIDVDRSIREQFNLLRIVNNQDYPAFFELDGKRYVLKIESASGGGATG